MGEVWCGGESYVPFLTFGLPGPSRVTLGCVQGNQNVEVTPESFHLYRAVQGVIRGRFGLQGIFTVGDPYKFSDQVPVATFGLPCSTG
jgi:hypothetical protein